MNNKTKGLMLASIAAFMVGFSSCTNDEQSITTSPSIHSVQNQNGWSKEVADVVQVAADEYVFWGREQQNGGAWALYAVRVHLQNGIVWEQRYSVDATNDEAVCIRLINNELWAVAHRNGGQEEAEVIKIDPSNGSTIGNRIVANSRINDLQPTPAQTEVVIAGSTSDVNPNKPLFDPSTDTRDFLASKLESNLNQVWIMRTGWGGVDEAVAVRVDSVVNLFFKAGARAQQPNNPSVSQLNLFSGGIRNQASIDQNSSSELLTVANQSGPDFALLSQNSSGNLVRQSVNINGVTITDNGSQSLNLSNLSAQNLLTSGSNYLLTANNGSDVKIYLLSSAFAVQSDVTITNALVAANASNVRISKTIPIGNGQFLATLNYQLNGSGQIAYVKLSSNGNLVP